MTRRRLRARDRRALALGLILIAPVAAYRAGLEPWLAYRAGVSDALQAERDLLVREQSAVEGASKLPVYAEVLRAELREAEPWLLEGDAQMAVAGALTRHVTGAAQAAGILIQRVDTRDPDAAGGLLRATSLSLRILGDLEGLTTFLHMLESGTLMLRVDELSLRLAGVNDGDLERGQLMAAGLVVTGYWLDQPNEAEAVSFAGMPPEGNP
jgi:hypothetical protein